MQAARAGMRRRCLVNLPLGLLSMSSATHFFCIQCRKCCHNLRLPLSVDEAIGWLRDSGEVQVFCEAIPWREDPPSGNLQALDKRRRSVRCTERQSTRGYCDQSGRFVRCPLSLFAIRYSIRCVCEADTRMSHLPGGGQSVHQAGPDSKARPPEAWGVEKLILTHGEPVADPDIARFIGQPREAMRRTSAQRKGAWASLFLYGIGQRGIRD
jgi:hypothetical protein